MIYYDTPFQPEDVGYDGSRFKVLEKHFEKMLAKDQLQGASICMARDGKIFIDAAMGRYCYRPEDTRELKPDHIHRIASITKLFTAVAIFQLCENGELLIGQKVSEILKEFDEPPYKEITIGQLMTHTSGLVPDGGCFPSPYNQTHWDFIDQGFKEGDANWLTNALKAGLHAKPGTEWAYSTFGYSVLGEIITRITGTPAEQYITEHILKPCEMMNSMFESDFTKETYLRTVIRSEEAEKRHEACSAGLVPEQTPIEKLWASVPDTGGGLYSNASDLAKFGTMLLHNGSYRCNRIVSRKSVEKMTSLAIDPSTPDYCWDAGGVSRAYGLGPDLRCNWNHIYTPGTYFHEGAGSCSLIIDPKEKLVAAWFVPYTHDAWYAEGLYNASNIMWSGLL